MKRMKMRMKMRVMIEAVTDKPGTRTTMTEAVTGMTRMMMMMMMPKVRRGLVCFFLG